MCPTPLVFGPWPRTLRQRYQLASVTDGPAHALKRVDPLANSLQVSFG